MNEILKKVRFNLPEINEEICQSLLEEKKIEPLSYQFFYYHKHEPEPEDYGQISLEFLQKRINDELEKENMGIDLQATFDSCLSSGDHAVVDALKKECLNDFLKKQSIIKKLYGVSAMLVTAYVAYMNFEDLEKTLTEKILYSCGESAPIIIFFLGLHYFDKRTVREEITHVFQKYSSDINIAFRQYQEQLAEEKSFNHPEMV